MRIGTRFLQDTGGGQQLQDRGTYASGDEDPAFARCLTENFTSWNGLRPGVSCSLGMLVAYPASMTHGLHGFAAVLFPPEDPMDPVS